MKGFTAFVGLAVFLALAYGAHQFLKRSVQDQEVIEWANSLVWDAIGSQSPVTLLAPEVTPGGQPNSWMVSGRIALRLGEGDAVAHPYTAQIVQICEPDEERECWRLEELTIAGSEVDLSDLASDRAPGTAATGTRKPPAATASQPERAAKAAGSGSDQIQAPRAGTPSASAGLGTSQDGQTIQTPDGAMANAESADTSAQDTAAPDAAAPEEPATAEARSARVVQESAEQASLPADREGLIAQIQIRLRDLGYEPGPVDGLMGPQTRAAIESYQQSHGLALDGEPSSELLQHLLKPR